MKTIVVSLSAAGAQESTVYVGAGLLEKIAELAEVAGYSQIFVVTDENARRHWLDGLLGGLPEGTGVVVLPSGEEAKQIDSVQRIWAAMLAAGCDRKSLVINLGGGVVGDMGGFAASTYMRGVAFVNVPTTLLAQVDASVGGKTGFDFAGIKNLIGTFSQPVAIVIDTQTLATLPDAEFVSGFAEIIKHGLIRDARYYEQVTARPPRQFSEAELERIIYRSCQIKAEIVAADPKEGGARKLVNFGHTIGHAIEALSLEGPMPLLHGQAVAIGMVAEAKLSELLGMIAPTDVMRLAHGLARAGLPTACQVDAQAARAKMRSDKKNKKGSINFTLLKSIGEAVYDRTPPNELIDQALAYVAEGRA